MKIVSKRDYIKLFLSKELAIHLGLTDETTSEFAWSKNLVATLGTETAPTFQISFIKSGEVYYGKPIRRSQYIITFLKKTKSEVKSYPLFEIIVAPINL